jgi:hypothetical protein
VANTEPTKTEVKRVNKGDLALLTAVADGEAPDPTTIVNADNYPRAIWRGLVVDKKQPSKNYAFYWHREPTHDGDEFAETEFDELTDMGYFPVNEKDFDVKKWRRTADGKIKSGRYILMACPEEEFEARRIKKLRRLGAEIDQTVDGFHGTADSMGVGTWETRGGRTRDVVKPKNNVNLG